MQHHLDFDSAILIGPLPRICSDCTVRAFVNCFVPGWCARRTSSPLWRRGENALRVADNLYGFRPREGRSPAELWKALGRSIPFLDKHLRNTAYLLASAIWNEDEIRAERYRDCLLRWLDTLRPEMQTDILLSHHALLTPDLFALDWAAVETRLQAYRRHPWPELPPPEAVFAIILRGFFDDVLLITAGSGSPGMSMGSNRATSVRARQRCCSDARSSTEKDHALRLATCGLRPYSARSFRCSSAWRATNGSGKAVTARALTVWFRLSMASAAKDS